MIRKIPWRRKWQPAPIFLPGESHGQRKLVDFSPWDHKESDMTECAHMSARAHTHTHTDTHIHTHTVWRGEGIGRELELPLLGD